jgi:hypothetical protein
MNETFEEARGDDLVEVFWREDDIFVSDMLDGCCSGSAGRGHSP